MLAKLKILLSWILLAGGSFFLILGAREFLAGHFSQNEAASQWKEREIEQPAEISASHGLAGARAQGRRSGDTFARLAIPRLHSVLYVVEGTANEDLRRGPGHLEGTALPGTTGNCVIAGHRDTHFRVLKDIRKGDEVEVQTSHGQYTYRVSQLSIVSPDNTASLMPTATPVLNLITCYPFSYVGSAPKRFIVHADLMERRASM